MLAFRYGYAALAETRDGTVLGRRGAMLGVVLAYLGAVLLLVNLVRLVVQTDLIPGF